MFDPPKVILLCPLADLSLEGVKFFTLRLAELLPIEVYITSEVDVAVVTAAVHIVLMEVKLDSSHGLWNKVTGMITRSFCTAIANKAHTAVTLTDILREHSP